MIFFMAYPLTYDLHNHSAPRDWFPPSAASEGSPKEVASAFLECWDQVDDIQNKLSASYLAMTQTFEEIYA